MTIKQYCKLKRDARVKVTTTPEILVKYAIPEHDAKLMSNRVGKLQSDPNPDAYDALIFFSSFNDGWYVPLKYLALPVKKSKVVSRG